MISECNQLPDAPGIHGLRFRHFRGGDDFKHMATITRVSAEADDTERADTPEELANFFRALNQLRSLHGYDLCGSGPGDAANLR